MRRKFKRVRSYMTIMVLVACQNGANKGPSSGTEKPLVNSKSLSTKKPYCGNKNIIKILGDGRTIFSKIEDQRESHHVLWDVFSQKITRNISIVLNVMDISPKGKYLVERINQNRLKILSIEEQNVTYSETIVFRKGRNPISHFSAGGGHLFITHKNDFKSYALNIFDINKREFVYNEVLKKSQSFFLNNEEDLFIFDSYYSKNNFVRHINLVTGEEVIIWLEKGQLGFSGASKSRLISKVDNVFYSHPSYDDGMSLVLSVKDIFDIDSSSNKAFVKTRDNKFGIINLESGEVIYLFNNDSEALGKHCLLVAGSESLICLNQKDPQMLRKYNLKSHSYKDVCL